MKIKSRVLISFLVLFMLRTGDTLVQAQQLGDAALPVTEVLTEVIEKTEAECLWDSTFFSNKRITPKFVLLKYSRVYAYPPESFLVNDISEVISEEEFSNMQSNYGSANWDKETWNFDFLTDDQIRITSDINTCQKYMIVSEPLFNKEVNKALVYKYQGGCFGGSYSISVLRKENEKWKLKGTFPAGISHAPHSDCE